MSEDETKKDPPAPDLSEPPAQPKEPVASTPPPPPPEETEVVSADATASGAVAPMGTRILAGLIDCLVVIVISSIVSTILRGGITGGSLGWLVSAAYWVTRDSLPFLGGQSIGKKAMKLKVEKLSGGDIVNDWNTAFMRNILLIIPFGGLLELIMVIVRDKDSKPEKRFGDDMGKTKVVVVG